MRNIPAGLRKLLAQTGKRRDENDVWIAALCVRYGLTLYTRDADRR